jgi:hypothetical protein
MSLNFCYARHAYAQSAVAKQCFMWVSQCTFSSCAQLHLAASILCWDLGFELVHGLFSPPNSLPVCHVVIVCCNQFYCISSDTVLLNAPAEFVRPSFFNWLQRKVCSPLRSTDRPPFPLLVASKCVSPDFEGTSPSVIRISIAVVCSLLCFLLFHHSCFFCVWRVFDGFERTDRR